MKKIFLVLTLVTSTISTAAHAETFLFPRFQKTAKIEKYILDNREHLTIDQCMAVAYAKRSTWGAIYLTSLCHTKLKEKSNYERCMAAVTQTAENSGNDFISREDHADSRRACVFAYPTSDVVEQCFRQVDAADAYNFNCDENGTAVHDNWNDDKG